MSADQGDKPTPPVPGQPRRAVTAPPPVARSARRNAEQVITAPAADVFSTPSVTPDTAAPGSLSGNEPPIFGGINPPTATSGATSFTSPTASLPASPPEIMGITPAHDTENSEDEMTTGPIIRPSPAGIMRFILRSNTALLLLLTCALLIGTWFIVETVAAESYVHVAINMRSAVIATPEEAEAGHVEIQTLLRNYPLRAASKAILSKRNPNLSPGFLDNMLFSGADAVTWTTPTTFKLRINTVAPGEDGARLSAVAEAFMQVARTREFSLRESQERIANLQVHLKELHLQQQQVKEDEETLTPGIVPATRSGDVEFAGALEQRVNSTTADIAREQRILDTWLAPQDIDPAGVQVYDNRVLRRNLLLGLWAGLLAVVGTPILMNMLRLRKQRLARKRPRKALAVGP